MDGLKQQLQSRNSWMWLYIAAMVPTYVLPYLGSNSLVIGAASGGATAPLFLVHLACLIALIVFANIRGDIIGNARGWSSRSASVAREVRGDLCLGFGNRRMKRRFGDLTSDQRKRSVDTWWGRSADATS